MGIIAAVFLNAAHFLNGCNNQCVGRIVTFQFCHQNIGIFCVLYRTRIVGKAAIIHQRLGSQLYTVHQKHHFVGVLGTGNQLGRFETGQGLTGAGGMPDIAATLIFICPVPHGNAAGNAGSRVILIAAHDFQYPVSIVSYCVKSNQLVCHRDGEQILGNILPVVQRLIIGVSPMEVEVFVEHSIRAGIGKINRLIRLYGNKNLHQGEQAGEHTFMGVFFNLVISLAHIYAAALEFTVDHGHTVN